MAKAKKETATVGRESANFAAMMDSQRTSSDAKVFMGAEGDSQFVGLELPAFCLMWLFDSNIFPVARTIGIAGAPGAHKSALGFEVVRWFQKENGFGHLVETEGSKYSPSLIASLQGEEMYAEGFSISPVQSVEEAQDRLTTSLKWYMKEDNKTMLTAFILDSLVGVETDGNIEKLVKEGHVTANMGQAKSWKAFLRWYSTHIVDYPISFIMINHLQTAIAAGGYGPPPKYTPGGDAQRYYSALYFFVTRMSKNTEKKEFYYAKGEKIPRLAESSYLRIKCDKTSLGKNNNREILVNFCWYNDPDGKQRSYWDWDGATCELMVLLQDEKSSAFDFSKLRDVLDITETKTSGRNTYKSKRLGMEDAEAYEIGAAIQADPEMRNTLKKFFHIECRDLWTGAMPIFKRTKKKEEE